MVPNGRYASQVTLMRISLKILPSIVSRYLIAVHRILVEGKEYDILAEHVDPITLHYGEPWNWNDTIATAKLNLNGRPGIAIHIL